MSPSKRLVVFCDGTWIGRETAVPQAPDSNIRQLADLVGTVSTHAPTATERNRATQVLEIATHSADVVAGYHEGVGLNQTFLEYLWNGGTASSIADECKSVYKFIVDNYTTDHEIWMFGLSRGSFTIRCVAGMISNCGIINRDQVLTLPNPSNRPDDDRILDLCTEVYRTYRSDLPVDRPDSPRCRALRARPFIWQVAQPIRFMGLIDTVGGLGIPFLNAGIGFDWPEYQFHDQTCSSVVKTVYHAPALHDRIWIFKPCLIFPGKGNTEIKQMWFPGTHYDLGRQTFRFLRQRPWNTVERWLGTLPNLLSNTVYPNQVLSDCVMRWLLQGVQAQNETLIYPNLGQQITRLGQQMAAPNSSSLGSGDVYDDLITKAIPGGVVTAPLRRLLSIPFKFLNSIVPRLGDDIYDLTGVNLLIDTILAKRDRRIPKATPQEDVYQYTNNERVVNAAGAQVTFTVEATAAMTEARYPSRTYETFLERVLVFGW